MALTFPIVRMRWRVAADDARRLVCAADRPDAGGMYRQTAFAQSPVCHAIRRGESATQAARRVTGNGRNAYQAWFQIMNPSSRFVPKSQYNRIRAGWRACVIKPTIQSLSSNANPRRRARSCRRIRSSQRLRCSRPTRGAHGTRERGHRRWRRRYDRSPQPPASFEASGVPISRCCGFALRWSCRGSGGGSSTTISLAGRRHPSIVRYFVHRFVDEFERPLVRYDVGERPVRSRLRCGARRGRFDILLAPGEGRRYPNLSDHKKNVEYDVARVMHVLADDSFVSGALYTQAGWIVVPFQFTAGPKQSGVTCISSL